MINEIRTNATQGITEITVIAPAERMLTKIDIRAVDDTVIALYDRRDRYDRKAVRRQRLQRVRRAYHDMLGQ
jgi:hypothetical protein